MNNDLDLASALAFAAQTADAAGDLVRTGLFEPLAMHGKGLHGDVVTDLDYASERLIVARIKAAYPGHRIVSEEIGAIDGDEPWTWLIDPVDGTNNVAIGLPVLAVGITLCHMDVPVVGAVHDPVSRRTWTAIRGRGAWDAYGTSLRDIRMKPHRDSRVPDSAVLAWIQGYEVKRDDPEAQALKRALAHSAYRILELWAPLTCWAMLARGDIDGIVGYRIGELDLLAGALIADEAGVAVRDFTGAPFDFRLRGPAPDRRVLAAAEPFVRRLGDLVRAATRDTEPCFQRRRPDA